MALEDRITDIGNKLDNLTQPIKVRVDMKRGAKVAHTTFLKEWFIRQVRVDSTGKATLSWGPGPNWEVLEVMELPARVSTVKDNK